jgi:LysM repeat protein
VNGSGDNYHDIEAENNLLPNQDLVVGQVIKIPDVPTKSQVLLVTTIRPTPSVTPTAAPQPTAKPEANQELPTKHVVQKSEGLWQIAQHYYNDGYQYMKIYEANRDKMKSPEDIHVGMELTIPKL